MNKPEQAFFDEWIEQTNIDLISQYRMIVYELDLKPDQPGIRKRIKETGFKDWRFDFAIPDYRILIEINGVGTGHFSVAGYREDLAKYRAAAMFDWRLFPFMANECLRRPDIAVEFVLEAIDNYAH